VEAPLRTNPRPSDSEIIAAFAMKKPLGIPLMLAFGVLSCLAAAPLWVTTLLPFMDYPQLLGFVRIWQGIHDPTSPFYGTYTVGFPFSPLVLPLLLLRGLSTFMSIEMAGKVIYTAYVLGLPLASLRLLRVLDKDPALVLLVFPLVYSYWFNGGFFAYCTGMPLLVLGISEGIRWLAEPSVRRGLTLTGLLIAVFLWHALVFAELVQGLLVLWLCARTTGVTHRLRLAMPIVPALGLFFAWAAASVVQRPSGPAAANFAFRGPLVNAAEFLQNIGMLVPESTAHVALFGLLLLVFFRFDTSLSRTKELFRVGNPFAIMALVTALLSLFLPARCYGVEGINHRKCWVAALYLVFALQPVTPKSMRALAMAVVVLFDAVLLNHFLERFQRFDVESIGASRLIDRMKRGDTVLVPIDGVTKSFPVKPLIHVNIYATVRHGGLPNKSFAGYDMLFIRYVGGKNPMPGLNADWARRPELTQFDWVLLYGAAAKVPPGRLSLVARDGEWALFSVCGSRKGPACP
jgi:hypothetical protein